MPHNYPLRVYLYCPSNCPTNCPKKCPRNCPKTCPRNCAKQCPNIVPQTVPQIFPQIVPQVVPKSVPKSAPKSFPKSVPKSFPQLVLKIVPKIQIFGGLFKRTEKRAIWKEDLKKENVLHIYKSAACHYNCHALLLKAIFCWHYAHVAKMCLDLSKSEESSDKKFSNFHVCIIMQYLFFLFFLWFKKNLINVEQLFSCINVAFRSGPKLQFEFITVFKSCHHFLLTNSSHFRCLLHTSHTYFCKL